MKSTPSLRHSDNLQKILFHAFESIFKSIIEKNNLLKSEGQPEDLDEHNLAHIMLTVSGLQFRVLVLLHYPAGKHALRYLNLFNADKGSTMSETDLEPYYTEMGNQLCGEVKRHLFKQFYHLGMSTPSVMSPATVLADVDSSLLITRCSQYYRLNEDIALGGSLYVFSNQDLEFEFDQSLCQETLATGELEFF
jgi:hypothetical protein